MHTITIDNADKLRTIIEFARENKCADQLGKDLLNFLMILTCGMVERDTDGKIQPTKHDEHAKVYADFAPYSLCFALYRNEKLVLNGGWIYAGPSSPGDGSFPALSVNLDFVAGTAPKHSWSVHT